MCGRAPQAERWGIASSAPKELAMTSKQTPDRTTARGGLLRIARTAAALSVGVVVVISTSHAAAARETRDSAPSAPAAVTAYSEPQPALGGRSLARYLADHVSHVLGPVGV
jgi:hypothetical protein